MELFYVYCMCQMCKKKVYRQFIYCFWIMCILIYCKCFDNNTHAVLGISVTFWGKKLPLFYMRKCVVGPIHNVHFSSFCHNYMLFYGFEKHEKACILICMFGIQSKSIHNLLHWCVGVQWHAVGFKWQILVPLTPPPAHYCSNTINMCRYKWKSILWSISLTQGY